MVAVSRIERFEQLIHRLQLCYDVSSLRFRVWRKHLFKRYPADFYKSYHDEFLPYWRQFGLRPSVSMAKDIYDASGNLEKKQIPDDIWWKYIVPYFNNWRYSGILADKNLNGLIFPDAIRPETVFRRMSGNYCLDDFTRISREQALSLCDIPGELVIKPTYGSCKGKNVQFFSGGIDREKLVSILASYGNGDYIVQRAVKQHPAMQKLNPSSVNTVRIVTVIFKNEAFVESTIVRMGVPGSRVDNLGAGGVQCGVNEDGALMPIACYAGKTMMHKDISENPVLGSFVVPGIKELWNYALSLARRMPHLNMIAWDFAIDEQERPILIEFNTRSPGQNYETNGASFSDRSEEILTAAILEGNK